MDFKRLLRKFLWGIFLIGSSAYSQNPPPIGPLIISEIFLNSSAGDDGNQWVELFNRSNRVVNLKSYSLGNAGNASNGLNYTESLVQLSGTVEPHSFFVLGGPKSSAKNGSPVYDQLVNFNPDFVHGTHSADGVGLYNLRAKDVLNLSVPVDVVIFGNFENNNALFDNTGKHGVIDIRQVGPDSSIERVSFDPNIWQVQPSPNPGSIIDIKLPASVTLNCQQNLNDIILNWSFSQDPKPGSGLAGYRIFRDDKLLATVSASDLNYLDKILASIHDKHFEYQIQPFDSVGNVQTDGGKATCVYRGVSQISMLPEPDATSGTSNKVSWTGSPQIDLYSIFIAEDCNFNNASENTTANTFFTFIDLENGTSYCYWIIAVDLQQRSVVSDTVMSVQDASDPTITLFDVPEKQNLNNRNWLSNRVLNIKLKATDLFPGFIRRLQIFENKNLVINLQTTSSQIDTTITYVLISEECFPIELSTKVVDAAGNESNLQSLILRFDETPPIQAVSFNCIQLSGVNGVLLSWSPAAEPENCSGLAGYMIFRNGEQIMSIDPAITSYHDLLSVDRPTGQINYQIQPFDSVGNFQTTGGQATCDYVGISTIEIREMPEFSPGLSKEVCWTRRGSLTSLSVFIDENCDLLPEDSVLFANPGQFEMCHTFDDLNDGQRYCYWITGFDEQQRMVTSDTVTSIQDNTNPVVDVLSLSQSETLNGRTWVYTRNIQLNLVARDTPPGSITKYEIFENGESNSAVDVLNPMARLNRLVDYSLKTPVLAGSKKIDLSVRVHDRTGNSSDLKSIAIFLQENQPNLFAFPNPFNPLQAPATIRIKDDNETEVKIFDFFGNLVRVLDKKVNSHDFIWDGRNGKGKMVSNGGYICVSSKTNVRFKIAVVKKQN